MPRILHIDASARPGLAGRDEHGSHSRNLSHRFIHRWREERPNDPVTHREVGLSPPAFIDQRWIEAAFASEARRQPWMADVLAESDRLVDELVAADVLVIGSPLYNFGMPAALKAWVDQIVRVGRTVDFDPSQPEDPFTPLLADRPRQAIILSARGGEGFEPGGPLAHMNHLEPALMTVLEFIGINRIHRVAIEYQEAGGDLLAASVANANKKVDALADQLLAELADTTAVPA
ncbi:FMN-dependent NADH-azoreductase [Marinobacter xestospongiae]|uniref:FMN-dependent NADH-azoreductase n=1 Tax=Marinobacter xestospongiae TaxID=994319 RepID=UPI00200591BA|nr:NAD(P)H-dependent oxidoreductase [Marinobacter xestospongiae]MCK7568234.1 NAD(P)H-dependent oxidoreductase [Marinobacter xestospongiae]